MDISLLGIHVKMTRTFTSIGKAIENQIETQPRVVSIMFFIRAFLEDPNKK